MIRRLLVAPLAMLALVAMAAPAPAATPKPAWQLDLIALPANFAPATERSYMLIATNVGAAPTEASPATRIEANLPAGLSPAGWSAESGHTVAPECEIVGQAVTCETTAGLSPGYQLVVFVDVRVEAPAGATALSVARVQGGGALEAASATAPTPISAEAVPFGFSSFAAPATDEEGLPATLAGSHPDQLTVDMLFPAARYGPELTGAGHARDVFADLPRGLAIDPTATPVRCTEVQLLHDNPSDTGCPAASQIGVVTITVPIIGAGKLSAIQTPIFNMVPPPGSPASFGTDATGFGIYVHVLSGVRTDSDFGLYGYSEDVLALGNHSLLGFGLQLWGDPSAESHNAARGLCLADSGPDSCPDPAGPGKVPFLTEVGSCAASPSRFEARADSWEEPGLFKTASYEGSDLEGNPVSVAGCNQLSYEPTLSAQPTTNLADSPSGLDVDLHQPQEAPHEEPLTGRAAAELRDARVTLPRGMVVNPSQADGRAACSETQIGYLAEDAEAGIHFSKEPQSCPDASKLGTMEVTSPLLAEYKNEGTEVQRDPETGAPIPRPLKGSVYLAKPFENPFGSLLAIYLAVEDPQSGIVAKLAGRVEPDPQTGQLTTVFEENPELPLEDVKLHLFGGARGSLITPISCGTHTTASDLTPWSAPEGLDAHPADSFQTSVEPGGGSCPGSEGAAVNHPAFQAGTLAPQAGAYSPFVLKLSREDGSQRIAGIDTTLPPGLSGKLAGIAQCSDAQIAQARAREHPNMGAAERDRPSCPSSSEVGEVEVAAGAGPTPFHTSGHAYLAGPYKGAPLSLAVIVPAVAGPFDLGTVLSRVALYVNPDTAQIHAVSDPLPQIIDGIPLDVRQIALTMGRPQFTLNPTSCDPMQVTGSATSALGQSAALSNPFQVGGCTQLPFKPKLSLKLKGGTRRTGHPKLIADLKAKPGEANVAEAQVKLPPSAFLDQAHIRTVCTRVQFAADACPSGSIYGSAEASTPLLDQPLSGNVYLRSSSHKLPDLVVALKGPASMPIEIDIDGKTDSVKGALRNTFEAVPDAPVSSFRLELFGGKRGLVVNSRNLCAHPYKAEVNLTGQNGKVYDTEPVVGTGCKGGKRKHRHRHR